MLARLGALLVAASLLLVPSALALPQAVFTLAGLDSQGHLSASWTVPAGWCSSSLYVSEDPGVQADGRLAFPTLGLSDLSLGCSQTSWTSDDSVFPGTYYLQVEASGYDENYAPAYSYSEVRSVVVPLDEGAQPPPAVPPVDVPEPEEPGLMPSPEEPSAAEEQEEEAPRAAPFPVAGRAGARMRGVVNLLRADGTLERVTAGTVIGEGDRISTGPTGFIELWFSNGGGVVRLGPGTEFTVAKAGERGVSVRDIVGKLWLRLKKGPSRFSTKIADGGTRGTTFTVVTEKRSTRVRIFEGVVAVRNKLGPIKRTVLVRKGFETYVRGAEPPTTPRRFKPAPHPFWEFAAGHLRSGSP